MMRTTGQSPPAMARICPQVSPAAMVTSTKRSVRSRSTGAMPASIPAIIWGFTPRKRKRLSRATAALSAEKAHPSLSASASALPGVRLVRTTPSGAVRRQTAAASAPPMFPVPMKPN